MGNSTALLCVCARPCVCVRVWGCIACVWQVRPVHSIRTMPGPHIAHGKQLRGQAAESRQMSQPTSPRRQGWTPSRARMCVCETPRARPSW